MNWKLIFQLSLFGLAMAIATVFFIPTKIEPFFWLFIFIICAYIIAKKCTDNYFLHGFLLSLMNAVWITAVHILLYKNYMHSHPEMSSMNAQMPLPKHPRLMMLFTGPIFGALFGLVQGLFAYISAKLLKNS